MSLRSQSLKAELASCFGRKELGFDRHCWLDNSTDENQATTNCPVGDLDVGQAEPVIEQDIVGAIKQDGMHKSHAQKQRN